MGVRCASGSMAFSSSQVFPQNDSKSGGRVRAGRIWRFMRPPRRLARLQVSCPLFYTLNAMHVEQVVQIPFFQGLPAEALRQIAANSIVLTLDMRLPREIIMELVQTQPRLGYQLLKRVTATLANRLEQTRDILVRPAVSSGILNAGA